MKTMRDMRLLKTYDVFDCEVITEEVLPARFAKDAKGNQVELPAKNKTLLKGILQKADSLNQNGRIYPKHILEREIRNYQKFILERRAIGEADHPDSSVVSVQSASHVCTEAYMDGDTVYGTIELLSTPTGQIIQNLVDDRIKLGISSRGVGSTEKKGDYYVVQDDYQLITFDIVSEPSTSGAFMIPEGKTISNVELRKLFNKTDRIDRILNDILYGSMK